MIGKSLPPIQVAGDVLVSCGGMDVRRPNRFNRETETMSWKRSLYYGRGKHRPTKVVNDCVTNIRALELLAERDLRNEADNRTAIERMLGDPPPHCRQIKPSATKPEPEFTREDIHAGMIIGRFMARAVFGDPLPATPKPKIKRAPR